MHKGRNIYKNVGLEKTKFTTPLNYNQFIVSQKTNINNTIKVIFIKKYKNKRAVTRLPVKICYFITERK